jgi:methylated-DNA-[protein]-cysteine S-methyltransferase
MLIRDMNRRLPLFIDRLATPIGEMLIVTDLEGYLRAVDWADYETRMNRFLRVHYGTNGFSLDATCTPNGVTDAISKYFQGDLAAIDTLPVKTGGTPFQSDVWRALRDIPCGTTVSYSNLAKEIGRPSAVRAVGSANGSNPVGVVVPCHRVIRSDGLLTGYGGGIERKSWLLNHEATCRDDRAPSSHRPSSAASYCTSERPAHRTCQDY